MSTKIYDAFRIKNKTLESVLEDMKAFRKTAMPILKEGLAKMIAGQITRKIDSVALGYSEERSKKPFIEVWMEVCDRVHKVKTTQRRDPEIDFMFDISVFPLDGDILGIMFCEHEPLKGLWMSQKGIEDYHYQDSTDRPEQIPEAEWDQRREDWDKVLGWETPAQQGFSHTIFSEFDSTPRLQQEEVLPYIPDFNKRCRWAARDVAWAEYFKANIAGWDGKLMSLVMDFGRKWKNDDQLRAIKISKVSKILKQKIELSDL